MICRKPPIAVIPLCIQRLFKNGIPLLDDPQTNPQPTRIYQL